MGKLRSPGFHRRANEVLTVFWLGMIYPTVAWWAESVRYLVFISVYTIIISHVTAALAAQGNKQQEANMAGTPDRPEPEQPQPQQPQQPQPARPEDER